jgi:phage terminase large subunit-like protein
MSVRCLSMPPANKVVALRSWPPSRYSAPLSKDFPSDGVWLLKIVDLCWCNDDGSKMVLDDWQRSLILQVLELYLEGHEKAGQLRYRECFVSVARQNGKSVIGAYVAETAKAQTVQAF